MNEVADDPVVLSPQVSGANRFLTWLVVILIVISIGNFFRTYVNQDATDKAQEAAETAGTAASNAQDAANTAAETAGEGRDVSLDTLAELRAIIAQVNASSEGQPEINNQIVIDAFAAIARMEAFLCNGPCPEPG